jgi:hypothetical protein
MRAAGRPARRDPDHPAAGCAPVRSGPARRRLGRVRNRDSRPAGYPQLNPEAKHAGTWSTQPRCSAPTTRSRSVRRMGREARSMFRWGVGGRAGLSSGRPCFADPPAEPLGGSAAVPQRPRGTVRAGDGHVKYGESRRLCRFVTLQEESQKSMSPASSERPRGEGTRKTRRGCCSSGGWRGLVGPVESLPDPTHHPRAEAGRPDRSLRSRAG